MCSDFVTLNIFFEIHIHTDALVFVSEVHKTRDKYRSIQHWHAISVHQMYFSNISGSFNNIPIRCRDLVWLGLPA